MPQSGEITLREIREYIWSKYIDLEDVSSDFDEKAFLDIFEKYYDEVPLETDKESFYYGIMLFEEGWNDEEKREQYFYKALRIFYLYRDLSGETDWEAVEDRIEDIEGYIEEQGLSLEDLESKYGDVRSEPAEITRLREACPEGMTLVPGGEYAVGPDGETVALEPFYMDVLPVTNESFQRFIETTKYRSPKYWSDDRFNQPDQPTVGVSFFDAMKFAQWAGKELPTHEQWLAAAKGPDDLAFPWGDDFDEEIVVWKGMDGREEPHPSGLHPENGSPSGCLDMAGNVWEWTASFFDPDLQTRIIKGGSFADPPDLLRCDAMLWASSKEKIDILGFRCCKPCKGIR